MAIGFRMARANNPGAATPRLLMTPPTVHVGLRSAPVGSTPGGAATSITVTFPTGHVAGDILVFGLTVRGGTGTSITTPSGWTLLDRTDNGTTIGQATYWILDDGTLGSSVTVSLGASVKCSAVCYALINADPNSLASAQYNGQANASSLDTNFAALGTWSSIEGISILFSGIARDDILYYALSGWDTAIDGVTHSGQAKSTGGGASSRTQTTGLAGRFTTTTIAAQTMVGASGTAALSIGSQVFVKAGPQPAGVSDGDVMVAAIACKTSGEQQIFSPGWGTDLGATVSSYEIALTSDGAYAFYCIPSANSVKKVRVSDGAVVATYTGITGAQLCYLLPDDSKLYVAGSSGSTLYRVRLSDGNVTSFSCTVLNTGWRTMVATSDSATLYVIGWPGYSRIRTSDDTNLGFTNTGVNYISSAMMPDDSKVYFLYNGVATCAVVQTSDQSRTTFALSAAGSTMKITPDGTRAYIVTGTTGAVYVVNTSTDSVIATVTMPSSAYTAYYPMQYTISSDSAHVYVVYWNAAYGILDILVSDNSSSSIYSEYGAQEVSITSDDAYLWIRAGSNWGHLRKLRLSDTTVVATYFIPTGGFNQNAMHLTSDDAYLVAPYLTMASIVRTSDGQGNGTPSWIDIGSVTDSTNQVRLFWRVASSEPSYYDFKIVDLNSSNCTLLIALSGAEATEVPVAAQVGGQSNSSSTTITAPALGSWLSANGIDVGVFETSPAGTATVTPPTNYTEPANADTTVSGGPTLEGSYRALSAATTVGSIAATATSAGANVGFHVFIKEAGATKQIDLGLLDGAATVYAPTVAQAQQAQSISLGLVDSSPTIFVPSLALSLQAVDLGLSDGSAAIYPLAVSLAVASQAIDLGLLDHAAAAYAPSVLAEQTVGGLDLLDAAQALWGMGLTNVLENDASVYTPYDGRYTGQAKPIYVEAGNTSATPAGPVDLNDAKYYGQSPKIAASANSPAQWDDVTHNVPSLPYETPVYRGRSQAVHVFGDQHSFMQPPAPPACDCGAYHGYIHVDWLSQGMWYRDVSQSTYQAVGASPWYAWWEDGIPANHLGPAYMYFYPDNVPIVKLRLTLYLESLAFGQPPVTVTYTFTPDPAFGGGLGGDVQGQITSTDGLVTIELQVGQSPVDGNFHVVLSDVAWVAGETSYGLSLSNPRVSYDAPVGGSGCSECDDPLNPGTPIPPFTPGYLPVFRPQLGDPTTRLDRYMCNMESGAMVLDWHTRSSVQEWGGTLLSYSGRSEQSVVDGGGTNLSDVHQAWLHWGQNLEVRSGQTWADLIACLNEGRAVILNGDYGELSTVESCQAGFTGNHAISLYPYLISGRILVGDPLCSTFKGRSQTALQAYAEVFGAAVYGVTSPQKIVFAVSRPWTP